jgi:3-hydroxyacyl-CoA dehydrogenase
MAKVATSAYEAFDLGILQKGKDIVVVNKDRQIAEAKQVALQMAEARLHTTCKKKRYQSIRKTSLGNVLSRNRPNGSWKIHF